MLSEVVDATTIWLSSLLDSRPSFTCELVLRTNGGGVDRVRLVAAAAAIRADSPKDGDAEPDVRVSGPLSAFGSVVRGETSVMQLLTTGQVEFVGDFEIASAIIRQRVRAEPRDAEIVAAKNPTSLVERIASPPQAVFHERFSSCGRPVVLTDLSRAWPLMELNEAMLRERFGHVACEMLVAPLKSPTTIGAALDRFSQLSDSSDEVPYVSANLVPEEMRSLISLPEYYPDDAYTTPRMWLGPKKALTRLHRDWNDNFHVLIYGKKRFRVLPPDQRENLYCWRWPGDGYWDYSDVDLDHPDLERYPRFADAPAPLEFELEGGEVLFLPDGWFHQVETLEAAFAVNIWVDWQRPEGMRQATID